MRALEVVCLHDIVFVSRGDLLLSFALFTTECSLKIFIEYVTLQAAYLKFLAYINTILGLLTLIYMEENLIFSGL